MLYPETEFGASLPEIQTAMFDSTSLTYCLCDNVILSCILLISYLIQKSMSILSALSAVCLCCILITVCKIQDVEYTLVSLTFAGEVFIVHIM